MEFGSELRKRASPALAAEMRRRERWANVVGILIGVFIVGNGLYARTHGGWMWIGRELPMQVPWWSVTVVGFLILGFSVYLLLQASKPPQEKT
jgi:hypothetical protein